MIATFFMLRSATPFAFRSSLFAFRSSLFARACVNARRVERAFRPASRSLLKPESALQAAEKGTKLVISSVPGNEDSITYGRIFARNATKKTFSAA
ncbi:MAG: hypothetical protein WBW69_22015, partial [Candidatus Korobacteraceae bacterium]